MELGKTFQQSILTFFLMFSLVLVIFSLWSIRIAPDTPLNRYAPKVFNLIFYVPLSLWVVFFALGALLVLLLLGYPKTLSRKFSHGFAFVIMLVILTIFYGLPHIAEVKPRFVDSWVHGGTAKGIIENGILQPQEFRYQAYPSSFIFSSVFSIMTGIGLTSLLRVLPIILILLFFSFLTIFVYKLSRNPKLAIISVLIYGLSTHYIAFHFSPEIFGSLFFILLLIFLAKRIRENAGFALTSRENLALFVFLIISIATTHLVTQFLALSVMLVLFITENRIWKIGLGDLKFHVILTLLSFAAWTSFFSFSFFYSILGGLRVALQTIISDVQSSIAMQTLQVYNPPGVAGLLLYRRALYLAIPLTAVFGGYLLWKKQKIRFYFLLGLFIASIMMAPLTFVGNLPLERTIKLAFIPLSIGSAYLILERKKLGPLILVFLLLTFPLNFASVYWNEVGRKMTHDWEISSARFAASNFNGVVLGEFKETGILDFYGDFDTIYNDYYLVGERHTVFNSRFIEEHDIELVYITQLTVLKESWAGRTLEVDFFINSTLFNRIYSNEYSTLLLKNR